MIGVELRTQGEVFLSNLEDGSAHLHRPTSRIVVKIIFASGVCLSYICSIEVRSEQYDWFTLIVLLFFLLFLLYRGEAGPCSLRSTATFVICLYWSLLLTFSLHFSSSSDFLRSLFTQSSHLSCGLPRFLELLAFCHESFR